MTKDEIETLARKLFEVWRSGFGDPALTFDELSEKSKAGFYKLAEYWRGAKYGP